MGGAQANLTAILVMGVLDVISGGGAQAKLTDTFTTAASSSWIITYGAYYQWCLGANMHNCIVCSCVFCDVSAVC